LESVILDKDLKAKLNGLNEQLMLCDETQEPVGVYLPLETYKKLVLKSLEFPFSKEEIERMRSEKGGSSLADFWKRLGVK
jgi:hypothetical protein